MPLKEILKDKILSTISEIGSEGASITKLEGKMSFERHTLSKYLSTMEAQGVIYHKLYGKAKVWFINKAPLMTVLNSLPERKTFTERLLSDIISNLPSGLILIDENYGILFMNEKMTALYGSLEGKKFYSCVLGLENPLKLKNLSDILWGKADSSRFVALDKEGRTLAIRASKLSNPDRSFCIILIINDISAQKKAEETISQQSALLQAERETLNQSAIVSETDLQGNITYVNDKFCEISKYKRSELIGKNHRIINSRYHPKEFFRSMWKTIANGKVWKGEIRNLAKDGTFYWVDSAIAPVLGRNGKPVKYISIRFDITKLKGANKPSFKERVKK